MHYVVRYQAKPEYKAVDLFATSICEGTTTEKLSLARPFNDSIVAQIVADIWPTIDNAHLPAQVVRCVPETTYRIEEV